MSEVERARLRFLAVESRIANACVAANRAREEVRLLAVSKTFPVDSILALRMSGLADFGENRVQELSSKAIECASANVRWHMIGSLQTNKVSALLRVPSLTLLHSVDRVRLVDALQIELERQDRRLDVLLEINASGEVEKHGVDPRDAPELALATVSRTRLNLCGLMTMGPREGDPTMAFRDVARLRLELEQRVGRNLPILSMGMSGDMEIAIACGSTLVRVGTALFGDR